MLYHPYLAPMPQNASQLLRQTQMRIARVQALYIGYTARRSAQTCQLAASQIWRSAAIMRLQRLRAAAVIVRVLLSTQRGGTTVTVCRIIGFWKSDQASYLPSSRQRRTPVFFSFFGPFICRDSELCCDLRLDWVRFEADLALLNYKWSSGLLLCDEVGKGFSKTMR